MDIENNHVNHLSPQNTFHACADHIDFFIYKFSYKIQIKNWLLALDIVKIPVSVNVNYRL